MCGVTGYFNTTDASEVGEADLRRAVASLRNRGPDDHGTWVGGAEIGLGHTRLSILDLSEHGHQPMLSADGRFAMVFNGEIYNFADIRRELLPRGYVFRGSGDSEVILAAFQEWGVLEAVKRFLGMFAIALWDAKHGKLTLIRDRLGVKPLYYGVLDDGTLLLGSELKSLLAHGGLRRDMDPAAVEEYFALGYVAEPRTIFRQARKIQTRLKLDYQVN